MNPSAAQVAGTAGDTQVVQVLAYLERLTGVPLEPQSSLQLRSVHRAAFTSWARKQNIPLQAAIMNAGACTVGQVLGIGPAPSAAMLEPAAPAAYVPAAAVSAGSVGEIGIDMEEVESLPVASDYREDAFYKDHFTSAEIAYCILQPDARVSFCGLWAAKEAILKAGLIPSSSHQMNQFEISHDSHGRPTFAGCRLSISHTPRFAVAVCLAAFPSQ